MHILVVEDDDDAAAFIARSLASHGHTADVIRAGGEAITRALSGGYDAIVLDRMLPELNGVEIVRRLRAAAVTTPVLMLTALGSIADRVGGLNAGADDYVIKPFALTDLAARLHALARRGPTEEVPTRFRGRRSHA